MPDRVVPFSREVPLAGELPDPPIPAEVDLRGMPIPVKAFARMLLDAFPEFPGGMAEAERFVRNRCVELGMTFDDRELH